MGSLYLDCPLVDDLQANKRWQVQVSENEVTQRREQVKNLQIAQLFPRLLTDMFQILKNSFNTVELVRKWEGLQQLQTLAHNEHLQFFRTEMTPQKLHNS